VLDESARISRLSAQRAQVIFERGERAHPANELDQYTVYRDGHVHVDKPRPATNEKAAEYYEEDKSDVEYDYQIGEHAEDQGGPRGCRGIAPCLMALMATILLITDHPWRFKATCGHVKYSAKALQPGAYARAFFV
jgi:hypothetical protein